MNMNFLEIMGFLISLITFPLKMLNKGFKFFTKGMLADFIKVTVV